MKNKHNLILNICLSGAFIALAFVLPFLTGQIPEIGKMLSPMHIPVFLCAFICGWKYGLVVGLVSPLLRSLILQMPPLYPMSISMSIELGIYGLSSGLLNSLWKRHHHVNFLELYITLIIAMILGRMFWGATRYLLTVIDHSQVFTFKMFLDGALLTAWPGIILHLLIVPPLVMLFEKIKR